MKKVYQSKLGIEVLLPVLLVFGIVFFLMLNEQPNWIGIVILLPTFLFVLHMLATTYYIVEGHHLTIKCGLLFNKTIDIHSISKVRETNNPASSPATSLDRLEICFGKYDSIMISPKQKEDFLRDILVLNPQIEVLRKTTNR